MIRSATQLKAKVRNLSKGNSNKAQALIRNYFMECFLERVSLSPYRNHFILKGGMLVASVVGIEYRATMDIDTTIRNADLSRQNTEQIIGEIIGMDIGDNVCFTIHHISSIMEGHDYSGLRFIIDVSLDSTRDRIKIDISTGDVITPGAVNNSYKLMLEDRTINLWTYNLETLIAEKLEAIASRGLTNTRMRDYYDVFLILELANFDSGTLSYALQATGTKRNSVSRVKILETILLRAKTDPGMISRWNKYCSESFYISDLEWEMVVEKLIQLSRALNL